MEEVKAVNPQQGTSRLRAAASYAYVNLNDSLQVARVMQEKQGGACTPDQIAQWLGYASTKSGTYQARISAARHFGFVEGDNNSLHITDRARAILAPVMPEDAVNARADAFLAVELFSKVYEKYRGTTIPPEVGMRNLFTSAYGMSAGAAERAARILFESAAQAGMFNGGDQTRLVRPGIAKTTPQKPIVPPERESHPGAASAETQKPTGSGSGGGGGTGSGSAVPPGIHTAIVGLLRELPPPGAEFPKKGKDRFIKAFLATLDFVYPGEDEGGEKG